MYHIDVDLDHRRGVFSRLLLCEGLLFCPSWKEVTLCSPHLGVGSYAPLS